MTAYYGSNATKRDVTVPAQKIGPGEKDGRVHFAYDSYTFAATTAPDLAVSDTINFMKIPANARVIGGFFRIDQSLGGSAVISVGWTDNGSDSADEDGFFDAIDCTSAVSSVLGAKAAEDGHGKQFAAETQVQALCDAVTVDADTNGAKIEIGIYYSVD